LGRTVKIRYNVVAVDGLSGEGVALWATYVDNGSGSRVQLYLKRHSFETGVTDVVLVLDSSAPWLLPPFAPPPSSAFRTAGTARCGERFDFRNYAYFVEVHLLRCETSTPMVSLARVAAIHVSSYGRFC
jgi:hypothetical protein